jgi:hypothetical protein
LWFDELRLVRRSALHLSRRHRCAAFADLSSDKERLGFGAFAFPIVGLLVISHYESWFERDRR